MGMGMNEVKAFGENGSGSQSVVQMHYQLCDSFSEQRLLVVTVTV